MEVQKTLRQSIKQCHERRLLRMCSLKKRLSSVTKSSPLQNTLLPLQISKDFDCNPGFTSIPLHSNLQQPPSYLSPRKQSWGGGDYSMLLAEATSNKQNLVSAVDGILRLEDKLFEIEEELRQVHERNQMLEWKNGELEEEVQEGRKREEKYCRELDAHREKVEARQEKIRRLDAMLLSLQKERNNVTDDLKQLSLKNQDLEATTKRLENDLVNTTHQQSNQFLQLNHNLQQRIQQYQNQQQTINIQLEHLRLQWSKVPQINTPVDNCHCGHQFRLKCIDLYLEYLHYSDYNLESLLLLEPSIATSIKGILERGLFRNNLSVFSLPSFHKILGSRQQFPTKTLLHDVSHFQSIQEDQLEKQPSQIFDHQQFLARMEQQVKVMESSHDNNEVDHTELQQNYNAIKMINEQLFGEIQYKEKVMREMEERLRVLENFGCVVEHLKGNLVSLGKEMRGQTKRAIEVVESMKSLLGM